jgi:hypothetical protein
VYDELTDGVEQLIFLLRCKTANSDVRRRSLVLRIGDLESILVSCEVYIEQVYVASRDVDPMSATSKTSDAERILGT